MLNRVFLILSVFMLFTNFVMSQNASARLDKNRISIGDQIKLTLEFSSETDINVAFPIFYDTISKNIEIVDKSKIDTIYSKDKKQKTLKQVFTITSFDSGFFPLTPIKFVYTKAKDTTKNFKETQALLLTVYTVPVDTTKGLRDIKPPLEEPFTIKEIIKYVVILVVIAAIIFFIYYYMKKRKKNEPIFRLPTKPKLPPYEIALASLDELRSKKLWQNNKIKEFHSELTDIIRRYIEERFNIIALEMVSDDIVEEINKLDLSHEMKSNLRKMLVLADLVKFAKENPLPSEHDKSFNDAIDFVKNTIIVITDNKPDNTNINNQ